MDYTAQSATSFLAGQLLGLFFLLLVCYIHCNWDKIYKNHVDKNILTTHDPAKVSFGKPKLKKLPVTAVK